MLVPFTRQPNGEGWSMKQRCKEQTVEMEQIEQVAVAVGTVRR